MAENGRHIPAADIMPNSSKSQKIDTRLKSIISPFNKRVAHLHLVVMQNFGRQ